MTHFDLAKLRPEIGAAGYCRDDDSVDFYHRINALLRPDFRVLDFGAGRSAAADGQDPDELARTNYAFRLRYMKGRVARIVGIDIDPVVRENPTLDEAHVLTPGERYPFDDASFDLVFADWVVEHIEDVPFFAREIGRILAPGGWFCARTPNRWSYISVAARLIRGRSEQRLLRSLQPWRKEQDAFPKFYRMNTFGAVRQAFDPSAWKHCSYRVNPTPGYHGNRVWLFRTFELYQKLVPGPLATTMMIFLQKR